MFGGIPLYVIGEIAALCAAGWAYFAYLGKNAYSINASKPKKWLFRFISIFAIFFIIISDSQICRQAGSRVYQDLYVASLAAICVPGMIILIVILWEEDRKHRSGSGAS